MTPPKFKVYITDNAGTNYWVATQNVDNTWAVTTDPAATPLPNLPAKWNEIELKWARNVDYFGLFRSMSTSMEFGDAGRAILVYLADNFGVQCDAKIRIDMRIDTPSSPGVDDFWRFETVYNSEIDFTRFNDNQQKKMTSVNALDANIYALIKSRGNTTVNIPIWDYDPGSGNYTTDCEYCIHDGIYLPYNARYTSSATPAAPLELSLSNNPVSAGAGFMKTMPAMNESNSIPYIGNDIMSQIILRGTQSARSNGLGYNNWSQNSWILQTAIEIPGGGAFFASIGAGIVTEPDIAVVKEIVYNNPPAGYYLKINFCIRGIYADDTVSTSVFIADYTIYNDAGYADFASMTLSYPNLNFFPDVIYLTPNSVYTFEISAETDDVGGAGHLDNYYTYITFDRLILNITSIPESTIVFPQSPYLGFRPEVMLNKIVERLSSETTDPNGFAVINPSNVYAGTSSYLSDPSLTLADNYDVIPYNCIFTSGNTLRVMNGRQYISISLKEFFDACFAMFGVGLGVSGNNIIVEPLSYFFDAATEIYDFGSNVAELKVMELNEYYCHKIKTGYTTKYADFSQFISNGVDFYGVSAFNIEQDYKTPITKVVKELDWTSPVVADMYKIEAARANQQSSGNAPSSSNENYVIHINDYSSGTYDFFDPGGTDHNKDYYTPKRYSGCQDIDPDSPYFVRGVNFPDSAINYGLSPARGMLRKGSLLHAINDCLDGKYVQFQKQYWQLQNGNSTIDVGGIASNLDAGLVTEVADIEISTLPTRLFRPLIFEFKTEMPLNMYELVNSNPYGYCSFTWNGVHYKGFLWEISQRLGDNIATTVTLIAHPDTVLYP